MPLPKKTKKTPAPRATLTEPAKPMSPGEVAETVVALAIQANVPVFIFSEPGAGKSASVRALSVELQTKLHTIMLSVREPTDQGGLPAVFESDGEKLVRIIPPGWARDLIRDGGGTVLFDEISSATPETMNSALRIVQEGIVGDGEQLPVSTSFVLAGNPPETNVGANEITAGIANRCLHVAWPWDYDRWRAGMLRRWARLEGRELPRLAPNWREGIYDTAALVVSFLDTRPELAQRQPKDISEQARAWPSGRTWDLAATMLAAANSAGFGPRSVVAQTIVLGLVGSAAHTEWASWVANMDLPSAEEVLADTAGWKVPARQDQILAVLSGVTAYVARHPTDVDVYMRAWEVAIRILGSDPSIAIRFTRDLVAMEPAGASEKGGTAYTRGVALAKKHLGGAGVDYGSART